MNVLLIHQNFPGQFIHLAPALVQRGDHVVVLSKKVKEPKKWRGVDLYPYAVKRKPAPGIHPWLKDFESKVNYATACYNAACELRDHGFTPDVIVAHHGWGESLFLKDVWPSARMGLYCEFYYHATQSDADFDPEFPSTNPQSDQPRMRLRNMNNRLHEDIMDAGISPTHFQASTFPEPFQKRLSVIHDGIDTDNVTPNPDAQLALLNGEILTRKDEVVTFVSRNLEPYRGYHTFMRALPEILRQRPNAQIILIGGDGTSYGPRSSKDITWKQTFIEEVKPTIKAQDWARVHFLGTVPYATFLSVLQVSSVHVYLTYPFVLSWSLLEAMSAGCAVVGSDTAPVREAIRDEKTGILVDFFDPKALARITNALLASPERCSMLGANARHFVRENYDLKSFCLPRQLKWIDDLASVTTSRNPLS